MPVNSLRNVRKDRGWRLLYERREEGEHRSVVFLQPAAAYATQFLVRKLEILRFPGVLHAVLRQIQQVCYSLKRIIDLMSKRTCEASDGSEFSL
jgi:hypothetical protein